LSRTIVVNAGAAVELRASPINSSWIREGAPVARASELSRSGDGSAYTMIWDCTAGKFDWFYAEDETVHILEGSVVVGDDHTPPRRLLPGDTAFFPANTHAHWHVETYVRKVAFCRLVVPKPVGYMLRVLRKARKLIPGQGVGGTLGGQLPALSVEH
jgi:uncharacterized cupin superfamily protein